MTFYISLGSGLVAYTGKIGAGHSGLLHQFQGKTLAGLNLRCRLAGAKHWYSQSFEAVSQPHCQRSLWTNDHQICFQSLRFAYQAVNVIGPNIKILSDGRSTCVPASDP